MATRQRVKHVRGTVDLLVLDRQDYPILIGEVRAKDEPAGSALSQVKDFLEFADLAVPLVMTVDHDRISIYRADEELRFDRIFSARTKPILGYYSDYYRDSKRRVGVDLLRDLALSWLRDVSYRLRSKSTLPPAYEELNRLGVVQLLQDAIFESELDFGGHRLYRDESFDRPGSWPGA